MQFSPTWRDNSLLTGLRGVAAIWVAVFHFYPWIAAVFGARPRGDIPFVRDGFLGVDLFFLLSGYVLTMSYGSRLGDGSPGAIRQFIAARMFRILPVHWTILLALATIVMIIPGLVRAPYVFTTQAFVESALLLQGMLPDAVQAWNRSTWSISDECVAYLAFPFLAWVIKDLRSMLACLCVSLAMLALLSCVVAYGLHASTLDLVGLSGLLRCACEFIAGVLACKAWLLDERLPGRLVPLLTAGCLVVLFAGISYSSYFH